MTAECGCHRSLGASQCDVYRWAVGGRGRAEVVCRLPASLCWPVGREGKADRSGKGDLAYFQGHERTRFQRDARGRRGFCGGMPARADLHPRGHLGRAARSGHGCGHGLVFRSPGPCPGTVALGSRRAFGLGVKLPRDPRHRRTFPATLVHSPAQTIALGNPSCDSAFGCPAQGHSTGCHLGLTTAHGFQNDGSSGICVGRNLILITRVPARTPFGHCPLRGLARGAAQTAPNGNSFSSIRASRQLG